MHYERRDKVFLLLLYPSSPHPHPPFFRDVVSEVWLQIHVLFERSPGFCLLQSHAAFFPFSFLTALLCKLCLTKTDRVGKSTFIWQRLKWSFLKSKSISVYAVKRGRPFAFLPALLKSLNLSHCYVYRSMAHSNMVTLYSPFWMSTRREF